jgi:ABC-type multidrug transport system ATPase subunit
VLTTHYMDEAERLSDALTVLAAGAGGPQGTPKSVLGDMLGEHVALRYEVRPPNLDDLFLKLAVEPCASGTMRMARSRYAGSRYFTQVSAGSRTWPSESTTGAVTVGRH